MRRHRNEAARERLLSSGDDQGAGGACLAIIDAIQLVAPFDCAAVMTADPATLLPTGGVFTELDNSVCTPFWRSEAADDELLRFSDLARSKSEVGTLAGLLPDGFEYSRRYREIFSAISLGDELRVVFQAGGACFGMASFVRADRGRAFSGDELDAVRQLTGSAVEILREELIAPTSRAIPEGPVTLAVDPEGQVVARTPGAQAVLADLTGAAIGAIALPPTVIAPIERVRARPEAGPLITRVRGLSGSWYRLCVSPFEDHPGHFALTIDPTRASDLTPIYLSSYGLTPREIEVVSNLLRGLSAKEIAAEFDISTHTIRDHIKAIYQKIGVRSRGELHARFLHGSDF